MSSPGECRNLYSLNDSPVVCELGQLGPFTVNAKPPGAPYGVTVVEPRVTLMDKGNDEFPRHTTTATVIAEDIIYRYPGEGLFLAADDEKPSTSELAQAEKEFELADHSRIAMAHKLWDAKHDRGLITIQARQAARRRNQVVEWATNTTVELKNCPFCGELVRASAIKCKHCAEFLDGRGAPQAQAATAPVSTGDGGDFERETTAAMRRLAGAKKG